MMTFYLVGCIIAFLMLLSILAYRLSKGEEYELDIVAHMSGVLLLPIFSWVMVLAIILIFIFEDGAL